MRTLYISIWSLQLSGKCKTPSLTCTCNCNEAGICSICLFISKKSARLKAMAVHNYSQLILMGNNC